MGGVGRWERALVILAVGLGVVCLHALLLAGAPGAYPAADGRPLGRTATVDTSGLRVMIASEAGPAAPMPMVQDPGHQCVAVLAAAVALGLVAAAVRHVTAAHPPCGVVAARPCPPPRTAIRLALLCVLRN